MKEAREQEVKIAEYLIGVFNATCDKCKSEDSIESFTDEDAAACFYKDGWRAKRVRLLCPKCSGAGAA